MTSQYDEVFEKLLEALLRHGTSIGIGNLSITTLAEAAGIENHEVFGSAYSVDALLSAYQKRLTEEMLASVHHAADGDAPVAEDDDSPHDMLLDVLMARFDAMSGNRDFWSMFARSDVGSRASLFMLVRSGLRASRAALEFAGIDSSGALGRARAAVVWGVFCSVLPVWFTDTDSGDKTIAKLDSRLRSSARLYSVAKRPRRLMCAAGKRAFRLGCSLRSGVDIRACGGSKAIARDIGR